MTEQIDTDEQKAIFEFLAAGKSHLLIDALAGSGKTTTLIKALPLVPQKSVLMCAFNKPIATELQEKMGTPPAGRLWKAATFHSCGLKIVQAHRPRIDIRPEASEDLINQAASEWEANAAMEGKKNPRVQFAIRRCAVKLLRTLKETRSERELQSDKIREVGEAFDVFGKLVEDDVKTAIWVVARAYYHSQDLKGRSSIDFCDMTWLPVVLNLAPPSRYQLVLVDEAQDLSMPQLQLVKMLVAPNGKLVTVGDLFQAIYKWRGAVGQDVWKEMSEKFNATTLPLTTTFRCSVAAVKAANRIVPQLKARDGAPAGSETACTFQDLPKLLKKTISGGGETFVLSRNNSDLLHTALFLWKADVGFQLRAGKEIVEPLYEIIDKLDKSSKQRFSTNLTTWYQIEMNKAEQINASAWADRIEQQYESLMMMLSYAEPKAFKNILQDILVMSMMSPITLSTVHKVKGLEAERVFLLKQTFHRYRYEDEMRSLDPWIAERARQRLANIDQEELNLEYVAITRCKLDLVWVDMRGTGTATLAKLYKGEGDGEEGLEL